MIERINDPDINYLFSEIQKLIEKQYAVIGGGDTLLIFKDAKYAYKMFICDIKGLGAPHIIIRKSNP